MWTFYHTLDTQKSMKTLFGHPVSKSWLRPWHLPLIILVVGLVNSLFMIWPGLHCNALNLICNWCKYHYRKHHQYLSCFVYFIWRRLTRRVACGRTVSMLLWGSRWGLSTSSILTTGATNPLSYSGSSQYRWPLQKAPRKVGFFYITLNRLFLILQISF